MFRRKIMLSILPTKHKRRFDTIVERSDVTTAALKQDMKSLAESIQRVEESLTYLVTIATVGSTI